MSWLIAILLALILVALISSNQQSAIGVKRVIKYTLVTVLLLIVWALLIGYAMIYSEISKASDWSQTISIGLALIAPPSLLWLNRKPIIENFSNDTKAASKSALKFTGYVSVWLIAGLIYQLVKASEPEAEWMLILGLLATSGLVLIYRTITNPSIRKEIWFGPYFGFDPWADLYNERDNAIDVENERWEKTTETWPEFSQEKKVELEKLHKANLASIEVRFETSKSALVAKQEAAKNLPLLSAMSIFWISVYLAVFTTVGIVWDYSYAQALDTKFVNNRSWLAALTVIGTWLVVIGLIFSAMESWTSNKKTNAQ
jgi:hypothetical protein